VFEAHEFHLYESRTVRDGQIYEQIASYPLGR
jgi:2'-5' RNA ligase